jgi:hypothetical protein
MSLQSYEKRTTLIHVANIVIIILGIGSLCIIFSSIATSNANTNIYPFNRLLDEGVQQNISDFETNQTAQMNELALIAQTTLMLIMDITSYQPQNISVSLSPLNRTLISEGFAAFVSSDCATPSTSSYADAITKGYPNTTWQLFGTQLEYGFILYIISIDTLSLSHPLNLNAIVSGTSCSLRFWLDKFDIFVDSGISGTFVFPFLTPNPFQVNGCESPQCTPSQTLTTNVENAVTSSSWVLYDDFFRPTAPLPPTMNVTFKEGSMIYIPIS